MLNNFFEAYAIEAAEIKSKKIGDLKHFLDLSGSGFAYSRLGPNSSTHYQGSSCTQVGIDARFESTGYSLPVLPFENTHIIFGRAQPKLEKEKTFFKLEPHGLGDANSALKHAASYTNSQLKAMMEAPEENPQLMRREKDILPAIKQSFGKILSEIIQELGWDETTVRAITKLENYTDDSPLKSSILSVTEMVSIINNLSEKHNKLGKREEFLKTLQVCGYAKDDHDYRTGNEMVLSLEEIAHAPILHN